jgi:cytochrome P450
MPIVGPFGNVARYLADPLGALEWLERRYGSIALLCRDGGTRVVSSDADCPGTVFVFDPGLYREILGDEEAYQKSGLAAGLVRGEPTARERALLAFGEGLFALNGADHRRERKLLMPAFTRAKLGSYRPAIIAHTERFLDRARSADSIEVHAESSRLMFRIISQCLFGQDPEHYANAVSPMIGEALEMVVRPAVWLARFDWPGLPYRRLLDLAVRGRGELFSLVHERRASHVVHDDVLDALVRSKDDDGSGLTDEQIVAHLAVLFIAGHDTSANALSWTLFLLSQHPRIAADLYDELHGTLRGDAPTVEQLEALPLLDRVLKESMRVLPPVPTNHRIVARDLELAGHRLPRHTEVFVATYNLHRSPARFPEPRRFRPSRWETIDPGPHEYAPFGGGSRMCIGASFARFELKIVLAMLLQRVFPEVARGSRVDCAVRVNLAPKRFDAVVHDVRRGVPRAVRRAKGDVMRLLDLPEVRRTER